MDVRVGFLVLLVLGASWTCDASRVTALDLLSRNTGFQITYLEQEEELNSPVKVHTNEKVCTFCEEYTAQAIEYLAENKTQTEVIEILHTSCSRLHSFNQECVTLVDYYAPLFFVELSSLQPEDFCQKVDLCEQMTAISARLYEDSCGFCHRAVSEVLIKLKDPDTQLEIIEALLKGCDAMENYVKKCKRMVFEYGPLILANSAKFLETTDICITFHACQPSEQASSQVKASLLLSDS